MMLKALCLLRHPHRRHRAVLIASTVRAKMRTPPRIRTLNCLAPPRPSMTKAACCRCPTSRRLCPHLHRSSDVVAAPVPPCQLASAATGRLLLLPVRLVALPSRICCKRLLPQAGSASVSRRRFLQATSFRPSCLVQVKEPMTMANRCRRCSSLLLSSRQLQVVSTQKRTCPSRRTSWPGLLLLRRRL